MQSTFDSSGDDELSNLPGREEGGAEEDITDEDDEAGGYRDGDEGEVLHQLELDHVLHVGHGQAGFPACLTRHSLEILKRRYL